MGTPLYLKTTIGAGYYLTFHTIDSFELKRLMRSYAPFARLIEDSAGSLRYILDTKDNGQISDFLNFLDSSDIF